MTATRILLLVLALALVAFLAKLTLTGSLLPGGDGTARDPARQLENVREKAHELEDDMQKAADRADVERDRP
jgi:hypothetical protein